MKRRCPACEELVEPDQQGRCPACGSTLPDPRNQDPTQTLTPGAQARAASAHEGADPLIGGHLAGCLVLDRLGQGGMGRVYRAHHQGLNKPVALKVLNTDLVANPAFIERFLREAQAAAKLEHPNVVQILNAGSEGGTYFIVMQFVEGEPLSARLRRERRLVRDEALRVACGVLKALHAAHSLGIVHRDIKPDNVMLTDEGGVKVADFGLARDLSLSSDLTSAGLACGTPPYMSPEQILARTVDGRSDLYSLGVVLYECLAGRRPFQAADLLGWVDCHTKQTPPPLRQLLPDCEPELEEFTARLLAKRPEDRYGSAEDALTDLGTLYREPLPVEGSTRRSSRRDLMPVGTRRLHSLLAQGIEDGATSLHIEPTSGGGRVRLRCRGQLTETERLSGGTFRQLLDACRTAVNRSTAPDDEPIEGVVDFEHDHQRRQAKLSMAPTQLGPRAALVLMGLVKPHGRLVSLGFQEPHVSAWRDWLNGKNGLVLVTGPAGSGKGQTVGGLLGLVELSRLLTVAVAEESMVESEDVSQIQVTHRTTRAEALRLALHQHPDLVLLLDVHGIPDRPTAHEAVQAAASGRRVLASVNWDGAADAVANLLGMGVEAKQLARTLRGIISPRLVRRICPHCREAYQPPTAILDRLGLGHADGPWYRNRGCDRCHQGGSRTRWLIYESFAPSPAFWEELDDARDEDAISACAERHGLVSMRDQLLVRLRNGLVDPVQAVKVLPGVYTGTV